MDLISILFVSTAFLAVSGLVFVVGQYIQSRNELWRRLPTGNLAAGASAQASRNSVGALVAEHFTEDRFGVDANLRQKLRRELVKAGFFDPYAIRYYVFARFCTVVVLPIGVCLALKLTLPSINFILLLLAVAIAAGLGVLGPDAYLSRRQSSLVHEYRLVFPDLLDLLNVCISAGLSVEASFDRIRSHIAKRSPKLGLNIELMGAEMRAGRSSLDALNSLADRLGLDEAASMVAVLRQSVELGGDVAASLQAFSEDMRVKRMLRAETKANELPVKMVLPMALGIFPVILTIVLLPVILKLAHVAALTSSH
jgi:tight adherence protein C